MWGHYMKMKKVSLRELVADKIVYAVLLAMTYWLWARNDWKDYYTTIQYAIDVFAFFYFVSRSIRVKKYKQEEPDEMSEANLKRCDAICLKIVVGLIVALGFVCAAGRFADLYGDHRLRPDGDAGFARGHPHGFVLLYG